MTFLNKKSHKPTDEDFKQLGKLIQKILNSDYFNVIENYRRFLLMTLARGVLMGVGSVIGATVVIALLAWILSIFDTLPVIGNLIENINNNIDQKTR